MTSRYKPKRINYSQSLQLQKSNSEKYAFIFDSSPLPDWYTGKKSAREKDRERKREKK